jgi:hypothetical protein
MATPGRSRVALLAAAALAVLPACASVAPGPTYTEAELQVKCQREGGWWRGNLIPGYCEPPGATMP